MKLFQRLLLICFLWLVYFIGSGLFVIFIGLSVDKLFMSGLRFDEMNIIELINIAIITGLVVSVANLQIVLRFKDSNPVVFKTNLLIFLVPIIGCLLFIGWRSLPF